MSNPFLFVYTSIKIDPETVINRLGAKEITYYIGDRPVTKHMVSGISIYVSNISSIHEFECQSDRNTLGLGADIEWLTKIMFSAIHLWDEWRFVLSLELCRDLKHEFGGYYCAAIDPEFQPLYVLGDKGLVVSDYAAKYAPRGMVEPTTESEMIFYISAY